MHRIVIVGGGAGGLELATRLGDRYGPRKGRTGELSITLIDKNRTHIWKPKLHEIAAGSMYLVIMKWTISLKRIGIISHIGLAR
jgi:NADH dehydrogenase